MTREECEALAASAGKLDVGSTERERTLAALRATLEREAHLETNLLKMTEVAISRYAPETVAKTVAEARDAALEEAASIVEQERHRCDWASGSDIVDEIRALRLGGSSVKEQA